MKKSVPLIILLLTLFSHAIHSQTTQFTYQGSLRDGSQPANGSYDFEFSLYSALTGGDRIGSPIEVTNVTVAEGIFTVTLDFGDVFSSGDKFLEIRVRPAGGTSYTGLDPRQPITSVPFAQKSIRADQAINAVNSTLLDGNPPTAFTLTTDPRLSDARDPLPGSTNYIQNRFTQQTGAAFNISGNGTANIFNANTQFNIGGTRVLSIAGTRNVFLGVNSGPGNTGQNNTFVGFQAGLDATSGNNGSFFGFNAGLRNTEGLNNTFVGVSAGSGNLTGDNNAFFGFDAGLNSTTDENSFFGANSGKNTTTGGRNSFFGFEAGLSNQTGSFNTFVGASAGMSNVNNRNTFIGYEAGRSNQGGSDNVLVGYRAGFANNQGLNNIFIGSEAGGIGDNSIAIGKNATTGPNNSIAIGKDTELESPNSIVLGNDSTITGGFSENTIIVGNNSSLGNTNNSIVIGYNSNVTGPNQIVIGNGINLGSGPNQSNTLWIGNNLSNAVIDANSVFLQDINGDSLEISGAINNPFIDTGAAGNLTLCRLAGETIIRRCASSIRYKDNVRDFRSGLGLIRKLRPVIFDWKENGDPDVGLVAEEVAEAEPLLTTTNEKGTVEGVKYNRIGVVAVNAIMEQQEQIESQQRQIDRQARTIERQTLELKQQAERMEKQEKELSALIALVCAQNPTAELCVENENGKN